MSNDDELRVDKEDQVGQLMGHTTEREESQPVLMEPVLEAAEKIKQMELGAMNERSTGWNEEETSGIVTCSTNAEEQMESRAYMEHELAVMGVMWKALMEECLTCGRT